MVNRCDSVDALMYAYYEMMKTKEENQMLEKNKDYVEFRLTGSSVHCHAGELYEINLDGLTDNPYFPAYPGARILEGDDDEVVMMSKKSFEELEEKYNLLLKKTGFDTAESLIFYLTSAAQCDTLLEALASLRDRTANSSNNSWKAAAECNSPKELIEKREALEKEIGIYSRTLNEWKEGTGCPSPSAAKTLIESRMSWKHAYKEIKAANEKLEDDVKSWKNVTGYSTPESYVAARPNAAWQDVTGEQICGRDLRHVLQVDLEYYRTLSTAQAKSIYSWKEVTGCDTPEAVKVKINDLTNEAATWEDDYNHLLALTGFDNEGEIEDFLEQNNDRNKLTTVIDNLKLENEAMKTALRASNLAMQKELENNIDEWQKFTGCDSPQKAGCKINDLCDEICKLKGDYDHLLGLTGYKSEDAIRVLLCLSDRRLYYQTMRDLVNTLKRNAKFTESNWQHATGCDTPGEVEEKLEHLYSRIDKMKEAASIASNWTDKIVEG